MDELDKLFEAFRRKDQLRDSWQAKLLRTARAARYYDKTAMVHGDDRIEMFTALRNWIVADFRLDPTMDPSDPDARRLVH